MADYPQAEESVVDGVSVTPRPMTDAQRRCGHYADMWGRCMDCGATWAQRAQPTPPHHHHRPPGRACTSSAATCHQGVALGLVDLVDTLACGHSRYALSVLGHC